MRTDARQPGDPPAATGRSRANLPLVGWREWVALPGLDVPAIKAKIDTGARSSALHAFDVAVAERHGRRFASFEIHPRQRSAAGAVAVEAEVVGQRWITSSNGLRELRLVVLMDIALHGLTWTTEMTLSRRDAMGFRMLLGRADLRGRFLVDPAASFLAGRRTRTRSSGRPQP
ncbi:MAG: ATP-dependent zinc protease [Planctomycetes bacterium]|nr:ATP-dependent zinc protease [Planctomycetota bacterium]